LNVKELSEGEPKEVMATLVREGKTCVPFFEVPNASFKNYAEHYWVCPPFCKFETQISPIVTGIPKNGFISSY
jgi:hypothetical protein